MIAQMAIERGRGGDQTGGVQFVFEVSRFHRSLIRAGDELTGIGLSDVARIVDVEAKSEGRLVAVDAGFAHGDGIGRDGLGLRRPVGGGVVVKIVAGGISGTEGHRHGSRHGGGCEEGAGG